MKNKTLLSIFITLLVVFLTSQFAYERKERVFKTELIQLDTTAITSIFIYPKIDNQEEILLKKENNFWAISKNNVTNKISPKIVSTIFQNLALIKTKRVEAKKQNQWSTYEVDDIKGSFVKVYEEDKLLETFVVGRYENNPPTNKGISYIRIRGENEVYAIDGNLSQTMRQSFKDYRNKNIINLNKADLTEIAINAKEVSTILQRNGMTWTQDEGLVDSITLVNYLDGLQNIIGTKFVDDFEELQSNDLLYKTLIVKTSTSPTPIVVQAFQDTTRNIPFIIHSSINPDNYFESLENDILEQLFGGW